MSDKPSLLEFVQKIFDENKNKKHSHILVISEHHLKAIKAMEGGLKTALMWAANNKTKLVCEGRTVTEDNLEETKI